MLAAALSLPVAPLRAQKSPALPDLLTLASDYVTQYARQLGAVSADEEFTQYEPAQAGLERPSA